MKCLITGCALVVADEVKWTWGDLHEVEGAYVFNAVLDVGNYPETRWNYSAALPGMKVLVVEPGCAFFERRGVIVVGASFANLNAAAQAYIEAPR